jgi:DNA-binding transcriptional ArsR family regulator
MAKRQDPLSPAFHALADPTRRAVLAQLAEGPATAGDLAAPFAMALPSFMRHLAVLEQAGLIATAKSGRSRVCRLRPEALGMAEDWLGAQRRRLEDQTDRLQAFLETRSDLNG